MIPKLEVKENIQDQAKYASLPSASYNTFGPFFLFLSIVVILLNKLTLLLACCIYIQEDPSIVSHQLNYANSRTVTNLWKFVFFLFRSFLQIYRKCLTIRRQFIRSHTRALSLYFLCLIINFGISFERVASPCVRVVGLLAFQLLFVCARARSVSLFSWLSSGKTNPRINLFFPSFVSSSARCSTIVFVVFMSVSVRVNSQKLCANM